MQISTLERALPLSEIPRILKSYVSSLKGTLASIVFSLQISQECTEEFPDALHRSSASYVRMDHLLQF